jgi:hypothetical protein
MTSETFHCVGSPLFITQDSGTVIDLEVISANVYSSVKNSVVKGTGPILDGFNPLACLNSLSDENEFVTAMNRQIRLMKKLQGNLNKALLALSRFSYSARMELTVAYPFFMHAEHFLKVVALYALKKEMIVCLPTEHVTRFYMAHVDICSNGALCNLTKFRDMYGARVGLRPEHRIQAIFDLTAFTELLRSYLFKGSTLGVMREFFFNRPTLGKPTLDATRMSRRLGYVPYVIQMRQHQPQE